MSKIIIGIHGLGNKPPKNLLDQWWKEAVIEGLEKINSTIDDFDFEMVYWADILHDCPLNPDEKDKESELFLSERYLPSEQKKVEKEPSLREQALEYIEKYSDKIIVNGVLSLNIPQLMDMFIHKHFRDLETYYTLSFIYHNKRKRVAREVIIERLTSILNKHQDKEILLIAHSMGSIIAYDALMDYTPDDKIDKLITIGSPLAQTYVMNKINSERKMEPESKLLYPENIKTDWNNLYDLEDVVAINYNLSEYFLTNSSGRKINDIEVDNNYTSGGKYNPHKSYGYLRTEEFAKIVDQFLRSEKPKQSLFTRLKNFFSLN